MFITCALCGTRFASKKKNALFCSNACRTKHFRQAKKDKKSEKKSAQHEPKTWCENSLENSVTLSVTDSVTFCVTDSVTQNSGEKLHNRLIQGLDKGKMAFFDENSVTNSVTHFPVCVTLSVTQLEEILQLLRDIKNLLAQNAGHFSALPSKNLNPNFEPAPTNFDDLLSGITVKKAASDQIPWMNMTIRMASMNNDWGMIVSSEELWNYGIQHKKIPQHIIDSKDEILERIKQERCKNQTAFPHQEKKQRKDSDVSTIRGPKAMNVPQFEAPVFNDDDFLDLLRKK